jgi:hypothetical protein
MNTKTPETTGDGTGQVDSNMFLLLFADQKEDHHIKEWE